MRTLLIVVALLFAGCAKKKSSCEKARDKHVEMARKMSGHVITMEGGEPTATVDPEAAKTAEAEIGRMQRVYVSVCEKVGGDKMLACLDQFPSFDDDCRATMAEFKRLADGS